jgi:UDP-3-O-[3-hydroxymyristoyl] glucosamine N-acyltransferase
VPITLAELARRTEATLDGDGTVQISRMATLESAGPGAIAFLANRKYRSQLRSTRASAVIVAPEMAAATALPKLVGRNPYAIYAKVAAMLHPAPEAAGGIHPSAVIEPGAAIAPSATVGPHAVVGAGAVVGERARIGAGSVVGAMASIAADVVLHAHVTIYDRCVVGPRSIVHSGAVIGADGFGMAEEAGRWLKIPQLGRVVIGADVEIGANTTIDRGAIDDTVLENDVKLDNQIQVGHNCRIGAHTAVAGCVGIAGSARIGKNCKIGGAAMINGHIEICDDVVVSGGTEVHRSITVPGVYTSVIFGALAQTEWRHVQSSIQRLPQMQRRLQRLEQGADGLPTDAPGQDKGEL